MQKLFLSSKYLRLNDQTFNMEEFLKEFEGRVLLQEILIEKLYDKFDSN